MGALVKNVTGTGPGSVNLHTRSIVRMSNGYRWLLIYDGPNLELWRSTDEGSTWALHLSKAVSFNSFSTYSMTIGANNNLHICYRDSSGNIKYFKATWSGTAYSFGSEETVASSASTNIGRFDLDSPTGDVVIFAGIEFNTKGRLKYFIRTTGNTWVNYRTVDLTTAATFTGYQSISIARDESITTGNVRYFCVVTTPDATVFNGDLVEMGGSVNPATGAVVTNPLQKTVNTNTSKADLRDYALFYSSAGNVEYLSMTGRTQLIPAVGRCNSTGWVVLPAGGVRQNNIQARGGSGQPYWLQVGFVCGGVDTKGDGVAVGFIFRGPGFDGAMHSWVLSARITATKVTWNAPNYAFTADQWDLDVTDQNNIWVGWGNPRNYAQIAMSWSYRSGDARYQTVWNNISGGSSYTPTAVSPISSATVATNMPQLKATLAGQTIAKSRQRAVWQLATDASFTSNLRTIWETQAEAQAIPLPNQTSQSAGGASVATFTETPGEKLVGDAIRQGTWYWRVALIDNFGRQQPYTSAQTFVDSHPPAATPISPVNLAKIKYAGAGPVDFIWKYSSNSPGSTQTAYQIIIEQNSDGTAVVDTGKITSPDSQATLNISSSLKSVQLRWKVKVWDEDDVQGSFSIYGLFEVADPSTVAVNAPLSGSTVDNPTPSIGWVVTPPAADATITQRKYRVLLTDNISGDTIFDSGWGVGSNNSYSIPTGYIQNNGNYTVTVQIEDDNGLVATDTDTFLTAWTPPAAPPFTVNVTQYSAVGYVQIAWTNAAEDADFTSWRVYRRELGATLWSLLTEIPLDQVNYTYNDYTACSGVTYQYAVVQTANRFGSTIESVYNSVQGAPKTDDYWLLDLSDVGSKFKLNNVTADSYTDEWESETINIIGKGRHQDEGTHWGLNGSLTAKLYDDATLTARQKRQTMMTMRGSQRLVYLRTPFGDLYPVSVGNLGISRVAGVGNREFVEITVPYIEVAEQA